MNRSNSAPIPQSWQKYIQRVAGNYAIGMFGADDARQVAAIAFLSARKRFNPSRGAFENYAKVAIRRALMKARAAEQRHRHGREDPDDQRIHDIGVPLSTEEDNRLDAIAADTKTKAIDRWRPTLPPKLATVCHELYFRDRSQRDLAASEGVSQPCISQRNGQLLDLARDALDHLKD